MILICGGDSWTQGDSPAQVINWDAEQNLDWYVIPDNFGDTHLKTKKNITNKFYESDVWPKVLGDKLGLKTYNTGRLGYSIRGIVRMVMNTVRELSKEYSYDDMFVIVGFTSPFRTELFFKKEDGRIGFTPSHINKKQDLSVILIHNELFFEDEYWFYINYLQCFLERYNIKYLFFNAFTEVKDLDKSNNFDLISFENWVDNSYQPLFRKYIESKFNCDWRVDGEYFKKYHPTTISHIEWANYLYRYIKDKKIL